jgi:hypothetical protein
MKTTKYKTRNYKTRKYKTRKYKTRKYKTKIKNYKTKNYKTTKYKTKIKNYKTKNYKTKKYKGGGLYDFFRYIQSKFKKKEEIKGEKEKIKSEKEKIKSEKEEIKSEKEDDELSVLSDLDDDELSDLDYDELSDLDDDELSDLDEDADLDNINNQKIYDFFILIGNNKKFSNLEITEFMDLNISIRCKLNETTEIPYFIFFKLYNNKYYLDYYITNDDNFNDCAFTDLFTILIKKDKKQKIIKPKYFQENYFKPGDNGLKLIKIFNSIYFKNGEISVKRDTNFDDYSRSSFRMPKQRFIANCWAWSLARIYLRTIINTINGSVLSNFMNIRITAEMLKNTSFDNSLDQFNNIDKIPITTPEGRNTLIYLFLVMLIDFIGINQITNVETKLSKTELEQQFELIERGEPPDDSYHHRELFFDDILKTIQYLFDIFKSGFDYIDIINEIFINFNFTEDQQKFIKDFITEFIKLKENKKCEFNYVNSKNFSAEDILNKGIRHLSTGNYILFYTELNSSLQEIMREDLNVKINVEIDWHIMVITNYNEKSQEFIIENSWGKYRDSYFKISMKKMMDLILDQEAYITFIESLCEQ